jgi:capsular exopolysaccharide synthesis family protein
MSEFFRALEQASKDRQAEMVARQQGRVVLPAADSVPAAAVGSPESRDVRAASPRRETAEAATVLSETAVDSVEDRLVSLLDPNSFAAEQYRTLRHLVEQMHDATGVGVIAVSSAGIAEGKTTTAINLAGTLAQARAARVLLVDLDLRRPAVARQLGIRGVESKGVVDALVNGAPLEQVVIRLLPFNLSVVPAGEAQAAPYDLLRSPRLQQLLDEARRHYDYVVIDTPPLVGVPDCRAISGSVDGFLVVVNAHKTPVNMLGEALSSLDKGKTLGLIFNGDDRPLAEQTYQAYSVTAEDSERLGWARLRHSRRHRGTNPVGAQRNR